MSHIITLQSKFIMTFDKFSSLIKKVGTCGQHVHLFNF